MKTINKLAVIALAIFTYSCDDILEEDIGNDTVQIFSPINNSKIESNVVNFKWNNLKGADKYRVQIYESDQVLILDSLTNKTSITLPLAAGNYIWRVRGENYAYESIYSFPSNFSTTIPDDLTNQLVILSSPENDKYVNFINVTLNWEVLKNAESYSVKVLNTVTSQEVFSKTDITDTSLTLDLPTLVDGTYEWRVKAKNADTETKLYSARKFNIDTTIPNQPKNTLPADNSTQIANSNISFTWSIATDLGNVKAPISYIVEFANDIDFNIIVQTQKSNTTSLQQTFSATGIYYWRVRAIDEAGNIGANSTGFKFTVN
ncbi:hypothetical protein C8C83_0682 [Flavobacterium sp. 90]|uniref:hypothetical protein n=1 Tax=unclassified Flavobacterium TaxID=196869 RepID=UPI000EB2A06D|nr:MULTISPECIES: hypothetical protein [unclassified Flavobacterium]RKR09082.1 hypothetical protein C8C82_0980 [Flavobacterium sp. 81]TCK52866.1 hypothetical protein C8C83_0682 [Flavobacterium sp. 90]